MRPTPTGLAAALLVLVLPAFVAAQDVIRLKKGGLFEGAIVEESDDSVTLQIPGGTIEIRQAVIAEIVRGDSPEDDQRRLALKALTRFRQREGWHFLYRDGQRVGVRVRSVRPDVRGEVPGYVIEDRLSFMPRPGAHPEVDVATREFVDAELRPLAYDVRVATGLRAREVKGAVGEDGVLAISERSAGKVSKRMTPLPHGTALPGSLGIKLAEESFEGAEEGARVFDPVRETFDEVTVSRFLDQRVHRGEERPVRILRCREGDVTTETWVDMDGFLLRDEIGSPSLVSLRAPQTEVLAWLRGDEGVHGDEELGLVLHFESHGITLVRPDRSFEVVPGALAERRVVSLLRSGDRASVDVLQVPLEGTGQRREEAALKLSTALDAKAEEFRLDGVRPVRLAGGEALRLDAKARRKGQSLRVVAWIVGEGERTFALVGSVPESHYERVEGAFEEIAESVRALAPLDPKESPFGDAPWGFEEAAAEAGEETPAEGIGGGEAGPDASGTPQPDQGTPTPEATEVEGG